MELLMTETEKDSSHTSEKELPIEKYRDEIAAQLGDRSRPGNTWIAFPHIPSDQPE